MSVLVADPLGPDVAYLGDYASFAAALADSTGYGSAAILERTRVALHKVVRGEAAYERDSVTFTEPAPPFPLLAVLARIAAENAGQLSVLDFGGSLGSTYFQCREFFRALPRFEWSIVEQPAHVECGAREFADGTLQFHHTIEDCRRERTPNVLLLSSVLQYLPEPWSFLAAISALPVGWIVFDRTPFIPGVRDRLTVEVVHPRIYPASYPAWFLSRARLDAAFVSPWKRELEFDALDRQLLDGVEIVFKGLAYRQTP